MTIRVDAAVWFGADSTVTVSAAPDTLVSLGRAFLGDNEAVIVLKPVAAIPPDVEAATTIRVRPDGNPGVSIAREGEELVLAGDPAAIASLARNVARLGDEPAALGGHIHVDHFPNHPYLRPGSLPLVIIAT